MYFILFIAMTAFRLSKLGVCVYLLYNSNLPLGIMLFVQYTENTCINLLASFRDLLVFCIESARLSIFSTVATQLVFRSIFSISIFLLKFDGKFCISIVALTYILSTLMGISQVSPITAKFDMILYLPIYFKNFLCTMHCIGPKNSFCKLLESVVTHFPLSLICLNLISVLAK